MKTNKLKIKMLGGFSVTYDSLDIIPEGSGKNKVIYFLEYIIANRHRAVPQNELIDVILGNDECSNPTNTLKNLAYRCRKLLGDFGLPEKECIYCRNGAYGFSQTLPCVVDTEEFASLVNIAKNSASEKRQLSCALKAIKLYDGDFLPSSYCQNWVIPLTVSYQNQFAYAVNRAAELLAQERDYDKILKITEKAITLYPYNEEFHIFRIRALYEMGNIKGAISDYEAVSALLFDELGVNPSKELQEIYVKSTTSMGNLVSSAKEALNNILADDPGKGAYYCNYHMFANTCRFLERQIHRNGQSAYLALCTITTKSCDPINTDDLKYITAAFHKSVSESLRQSDIYTRSSPTPFLVLLMGTNLENCRKAMHRVDLSFKRSTRSKDARLHLQYTSYADISKFDEGIAPAWRQTKAKKV